MDEWKDSTLFGNFATAQNEGKPGSAEGAALDGPTEEPQDTGFFRTQAIRKYVSSGQPIGVLRLVPIWAGTAIVLLLIGVVTALLLAFFVKVDVVGRAHGTIRPAARVRQVNAQAAGNVATLEFAQGQRVKAGDVIATIYSPEVDVQLRENEVRSGQVENKTSEQIRVSSTSYQSQIVGLKERERAARAQMESIEKSLRIQNDKLEANRKLLKSGLVSQISVNEIEDSVEGTKRQRDALRQTLAQIQQEIASTTARMKDDTLRLEDEVNQTKARKEALGVVSNTTKCIAPIDGILDAVFVKTGDRVSVGQSIGRVIPDDANLQIVAFLSERDRGFVKLGDKVKVEIERYPYSEFGTGSAVVLAVAGDLSTPDDLKDVLGVDAANAQAGQVFRVELEIEKMPREIRPVVGMRLQARFTLRQQRAIVLFFDPVKKWFE